MKTFNTLENIHTDHMSNMSMVHDTDSVITQAISYIPYGEVFVEQQAGGWSSPYLFNAKELDSETGLYYYGARYLDPSDAMWLSVDPLWEKYVGMTPYNYCAGNPVKLVEPDGRKITEEESINEAKEVKNSASTLKDELTKQKIVAKKGKELTEEEKTHNDNIDSRISQLDQTIHDIDDMFADENIEYKFRNGKPEINPSGSNEVTIYWDKKDVRVHEVRHAGQVARRDMSIDVKADGEFYFSGYGIDKEVDAYKAQIGTTGKFGFYSNEKYQLLHQYPGFDMLATETYWFSIQDVTYDGVKDILDPETKKPMYP